MSTMNKIKNKEDWKKFLPRGTNKVLAKKFNLTVMAVSYIIKREDVLNHPDLMSEARKIALHAIDEIQKHSEEVENILLSNDEK